MLLLMLFMMPMRVLKVLRSFYPFASFAFASPALLDESDDEMDECGWSTTVSMTNI